MISYIQSGSTYNVNINGESYTFNKDHVNYPDLMKAIDAHDGDSFIENYDNEVNLNQYCGDHLNIVDGKLYYQDYEINNTLVDELIKLKKQGFQATHLVNMLKRLMLNPNSSSVEQLYPYIQEHGVHITEDGYLLFYKTVGSDYMDKWSSTIENRPGVEIPRMPRNLIDDNRGKACSFGYHCGAYSYSGHGGIYNDEDDVVLQVRVDPADVVSVPADSNCAKLRVCHYVVLKEIDNPMKDVVHDAEGNPMEPEFDAQDEWDDSLTLEDICEGRCYSFQYERGGGELRHCVVLELHEDRIFTVLVKPEMDYGSNRMFLFERITEGSIEAL